MKRFFQFLSLLLVTSCGPASYALMLDSRQPSQSGLEMSGKTMSIVYLESENELASVFNNKVADALATALEEDYYEGEQAIVVYKVSKNPGADYSSRDTLVNYVMALNTDIVMILDTPEVADSTALGPRIQKSTLYVYDAEGQDDVVRLFCDLKTPRNVSAASAQIVGAFLSKPLLSEWKTESYTLIYYENFDRRWESAILRAEEMNWADAISLWMDLLSSKDAGMRSSAMYNIAMGCYMLKEYELADEWIKRSDETLILSLSSGMHKRIDAALDAIVSEQ